MEIAFDPTLGTRVCLVDSIGAGSALGARSACLTGLLLPATATLALAWRAFGAGRTFGAGAAFGRFAGLVTVLAVVTVGGVGVGVRNVRIGRCSARCCGASLRSCGHGLVVGGSG